MQGHPKNQRQTPNGKATGWFSHKRQATSYKLLSNLMNQRQPHPQLPLMTGKTRQLIDNERLSNTYP